MTSPEFRRPASASTRIAARLLATIGLALPLATGLVVRAILKSQGKVVYPWSAIFTVHGVIVWILVDFWLAVPMLGLALLAWLWIDWPGAGEPVRGARVARWCAVLGGAVATLAYEIPAYARMWRHMEGLAMVILPMYLTILGGAGFLAGWALGKLVARVAAR